MAEKRGRPGPRASGPAPSRSAELATGPIDRLLALAGDPADASTGSGERLRWFRRALAAWSVARTVVWTTLDAPLDPSVLAATLVLLVAACGLAWAPRLETVASRVALPALLAQLALTFPLTPNHFFLEVWATALLAFADPAGESDALVLAGLRWLTAIVLFVTGCQKLAYGHYWHGDFLAFMVGRGDRFADLFAWVLPADEIARLGSYDAFRGGSGPYRVANLPFVLMSNLVWIAELALPAGMLAARTRTLASVAAMAFIATLQLGAREAGFAILFLNLLALFAPAPLAKAVAVTSLAVLGLVALAALGILPGSALVRGWHLW